MPDFVGISISGLPEIQSKLNQIYPQAADAGVEKADEYIVNSLKIYPPYSYITVSQSGGWKSEKQRRYVMMQIAHGLITPGRPNRTQRLSQGWQTVGSGKDQIVANEVPYGIYEYDIQHQSQMHMLQGWDVIPTFLQERMSEIVRRFDAGVKNALHKLGLD